MSGRVYERKFDWDEARRLRKQGLLLREIADRLGVTTTAVHFATNARARAMAAARVAEYQRSGTCPGCGAQSSFNASRGGSSRCLDCAYARRVTTVRDHELRCVSCKEWKPDSAYPCNRSAKTEHRRFRHSACTACNTKQKRSWRERNRERQREYDRERRARRAA